MLKYLIYVALAYLIFKLVKNGVSIAIDNMQKPRELKETTELIRCDHCGGFFDETMQIDHGGKCFCSQNCRDDFLKEQR